MKRKSGQNLEITKNWKPATLAIRGGTARTEYGETSEALFLSSGYCYDRAEDAAARFAGEQQGMTYSRLQNPTVEMLEQRIALLDFWQSNRKAVMFVTHSVPEAIMLSDRIVVMRKGQIAQEFADRGVSKDQLLAAA